MQISDYGPTDAKILIIGEAPSKSDEKSGMPFCGQTGTFLKHMLKHSGIDYSQCYVTTVLRDRPPGGNFGYFYEKSNRSVPNARLEQAWFDLRNRVKAIKPNVVICLGAEALRALTGKRGIGKWRGTVIMYNDIKVIGTYNPVAVMRQYDLHAICEIDFAKVERESHSPEWKFKRPKMILAPNLDQVRTWINETRTSPAYPRVSFDIESIGNDIRCVGLARGGGSTLESICIPFIKFTSGSMVTPGTSRIVNFESNSDSGTSYWNFDEELVVLKLLAELFADRLLQKVGQNSIGFDQPFLEKYFGFEIENHYLDTMHAFHLLYAEFPKSLDFLVSIYTDYPNYSIEKITSNDTSEWEYNCYDCLATLEVSYKLDEEIRSSSMNRFYFDYIHPLIFAVRKMQENGITIDVEARTALAVKCTEELVECQKAINEAAGHELNVNSHVQVKKLLYKELRFPILYNKEGKPSSDEYTLQTLFKRYPEEKVLQHIMTYRKKSKLIGTFLNAKLDDDGKMRTSYNVSGTKNGRLSSSKNKITGKGMNLQNIPKDIRNLYVAEEGNVLVKGDLSQAETRVVAELLARVGDPTLQIKYQDPSFDIHRWMAASVLNIKEEEVDKTQRQFGKLDNHSGNYGAGPKVMQAKAHKYGIDNMTYKLAQHWLEERHAIIPGLRVWWADVEKKVKKSRCLDTCLGRKRIFFGRLDPVVFRDAYAFEPQSIVGDVTNMILLALHNKLDSDCKIVLQTHDEVVTECPESKVEQVKALYKEVSVIPLWINEIPLIIPIDLDVGKNWRDNYD